MIDDRRLREMFWLFGRVLPIDESHSAAITAMFGSDGKELIAGVMQMIAEWCRANPEVAEGYFDFIKEAIDYAEKKTDEMPQVDGEGDRLKQLMTIQLGYWTQDKKELKKKK